MTGATGNVGGEVAARLVRIGARVRCFARRMPTQRLGAEWSIGDLADPDDVRGALVGVDAAFVIWPFLDSEPAADVIEALAASQCRVVYLSSIAVDDRSAMQSDPIAQVHADMERMLERAGTSPIILRSDTLSSNALGWAAQLRSGDVVSAPAAAVTSVVDHRDVADAAVAALVSPRAALDRSPYLLTGPEPLRRADQVALLGAALGRSLSLQEIHAGRAAERLVAAGLPEPLVEALISAAEHRPPSLRVTDHIERLTGRRARPFSQWAADHAGTFS